IAGASSAASPATTLYARLLSLPASNPVRGAARSVPLAEAHRLTIERFNEPFTQCILRSPDPDLDRTFAWAKANTSWLIQDVPGLGRGPMGGLPDFPWWFGCDTAYGALAMLPVGQANEAIEGLRTLAKISRQQHYDGAVAHEVVSNGIIAWRGNLVEVPLFARALYFTYRWTGDPRCSMRCSLSVWTACCNGRSVTGFKTARLCPRAKVSSRRQRCMVVSRRSMSRYIWPRRSI
ncbi:MAG TPA: hypothetical protein VFU63_06020, partial [Ktedonobacterales bacterium]|nr:hypothetical protein [Ktedonobacterales bacterium]